jgi:hypothetical protein
LPLGWKSIKTGKKSQAGHQPRRDEGPRKETEAYLEIMEENPEDIKDVAEHQEVPNQEAAVENIGALANRSWDQRPLVRYRNPIKR